MNKQDGNGSSELDNSDVKELIDIDGNTAAVIQSILPYNVSEPVNEKKAKYLSFRASGFSVSESCQLTPIGYVTVKSWRAEDEDFRSIELERLAEIKDKVARELIGAEFVRNFRLALLKDYKIFKKSLIKPDEMTKQEHSYLMKARSHYTPQQLMLIQSLSGRTVGVEVPESFSSWVATIRRTDELIISERQVG